MFQVFPIFTIASLLGDYDVNALSVVFNMASKSGNISAGGLLCKNNGGASRKFSKHTLKGTRLLFDRRGSIYFYPQEVSVYLKQHETYSVIFFFLAQFSKTYLDNCNHGYFWRYESTNFDPKRYEERPCYFHIIFISEFPHLPKIDYSQTLHITALYIAVTLYITVTEQLPENRALHLL